MSEFSEEHNDTAPHEGDAELLGKIDEVLEHESRDYGGPDTLAGFAALLASEAPTADDTFRNDLRARLLRRLPAQADAAEPTTSTPHSAFRIPHSGEPAPLLKRLAAIFSPSRRQQVGRFASLAAGVMGVLVIVAVISGMAVLFQQRTDINRANQTATAVARLAHQATPTPSGLLSIKEDAAQVAKSLAAIRTIDAGPVDDPDRALELAWSPVGTTLATNTGSSTVKLWDTATGNLRRSITVPDAAVMAWSPDGKTLAVASSRYDVLLLDPATGQRRGILSFPTTPVPTDQPVLSGPNALRSSFVMSLAWSPDSTTLAAGYMDIAARLWDAASARERSSLILEGSMRGNMSWSPDGSTIAVATWQGIQKWDAVTGTRKPDDFTYVPVPVPTSPSAPATPTPYSNNDYFTIMGVAWEPSWSKLATITGPAVWVWDFASGKQERALKDYTGFTPFKAAWSHDGAILASVNLDSSIPAGAVILWDPATGAELRTIQSWEAPNATLTFNAEWSPAENVLAASAGGVVTLWGTKTEPEPTSTAALPLTPTPPPAATVASVATIAATPPCGSWSIVDTPNVDDLNELHAVSALSANDVWAVGWHSKGFTKSGPLDTDPDLQGKLQTLVERWDGKKWQVIPSPNVGDANNRLTSVAAFAPNDVWAVGYYGDSNDYRVLAPSQTLTMHWDGRAWRVVNSPDDPGVSTRLNAIAGWEANDLWAVGQSDGVPIDIGMSKSQTVVLHWNGRIWERISSPNPGDYTNTLYALAPISATEAWAIGNYISTEPQPRGGGPFAQPLLLHWDGSRWYAISSPEGGNYMASIAAPVSGAAWAVGSLNDDALGESKMLRWDGSAWTQVDNLPVPRPPDGYGPPQNYLTGVTAISKNDAWAVGYYNPPVQGFQRTNSLTLHWDGQTWTLVPSPNRELPADHQPTDLTDDSPHTYLNAVAASPSGDVWAVGTSRGGTIDASKTLVMRFTKSGCP